MHTKIERFSDLSSLSQRAAQAIAQTLHAAIEHRGWCSWVLSGGATPGRIYEYLAAPFFSVKMPWDKIHFFWGDERCVPWDTQESNFYLAHTALISKISIPQSNIHRMRGDISPPEYSATSYEQELRAFFQSAMGRENMFPQFDLVLLGLGADGHTASLFPGDETVNENSRWVRAVHAPAGYYPENRITLTLPAINNSQRVFFLVSGKAKAPVVNKVIAGILGAENPYPAACVAPRKELVWFIDEGGA
ncbi:MAG: 6-phosphogluconolactonase [Pseudomonadota bacterium]